MKQNTLKQECYFLAKPLENKKRYIDNCNTEFDIYFSDIYMRPIYFKNKTYERHMIQLFRHFINDVCQLSR